MIRQTQMVGFQSWRTVCARGWARLWKAVVHSKFASKSVWDYKWLGMDYLVGRIQIKIPSWIDSTTYRKFIHIWIWIAQSLRSITKTQDKLDDEFARRQIPHKEIEHAERLRVEVSNLFLLLFATCVLFDWLLLYFEAKIGHEGFTLTRLLGCSWAILWRHPDEVLTCDSMDLCGIIIMMKSRARIRSQFLKSSSSLDAIPKKAHLEICSTWARFFRTMLLCT
jgi:hypothetical protein